MSSPAAGVLRTWEEDPASGILIDVSEPSISAGPGVLGFSFDQPQPASVESAQGTADFRWWAAAAALRRGADFWSSVGLSSWQGGRQTLSVLLDAGDDLNAYYNRVALNFFHGAGPDGSVVYSAESPDVTCHEMGHAVLDSIKPDFWNAASDEIAAFHEGFADVSAIVSVLQLPSFRSAVLSDTRGSLYQSSRLSRLAQQLASAIRLIAPSAVESDCLRNAFNAFVYQDPLTLPQQAPATQLSSEAHSFSRVFSGAIFEILGDCLAATAANRQQPTEAELLRVSADVARLLYSAVAQVPVVANIYSEVASAMINQSAAVNASYPSVLKSVFVRRSILSLASAATSQRLPTVAAMVAMAPAAAMSGLATCAMDGSAYGLDAPLLVNTASQPRSFAVTAAALTGGSVDPPSATSAAKAFVDDLFRRGQVHYGDAGDPQARLTSFHRLKTHELVPDEQGYRLNRRLFDCRGRGLERVGLNIFRYGR